MNFGSQANYRGSRIIRRVSFVQILASSHLWRVVGLQAPGVTEKGAALLLLGLDRFGLLTRSFVLDEFPER